MQTFTKTREDIELHCLNRCYEHIRLYDRQAVDQLLISIDQCDQRVPVIVLPDGEQKWVLIDGYLRIKALQKLGKDVVHAEIWHCDHATALTQHLASKQTRPWMAIEEASLLNELRIRHQLSLEKIAHQIGKSKSWVSTRLSLIEELSDRALQAVLEGTLSTWVATRIMLPFARANKTHTEQFLQYLTINTQSTRAIKQFFEHYQRSNHQIRNQMVAKPDLFFRALKITHVEKQAHLLMAGPERKWVVAFSELSQRISPLIKLVPTIIYPRQEATERQAVLKAFEQCKSQFDLLTQAIRSQHNA